MSIVNNFNKLFLVLCLSAASMFLATRLNGEVLKGDLLGLSKPSAPADPDAPTGTPSGEPAQVFAPEYIQSLLENPNAFEDITNVLKGYDKLTTEGLKGSDGFTDADGKSIDHSTRLLTKEEYDNYQALAALLPEGAKTGLLNLEEKPKTGSVTATPKSGTSDVDRVVSLNTPVISGLWRGDMKNALSYLKSDHEFLSTEMAGVEDIALAKKILSMYEENAGKTGLEKADIATYNEVALYLPVEERVKLTFLSKENRAIAQRMIKLRALEKFNSEQLSEYLNLLSEDSKTSVDSIKKLKTLVLHIIDRDIPVLYELTLDVDTINTINWILGPLEDYEGYVTDFYRVQRYILFMSMMDKLNDQQIGAIWGPKELILNRAYSLIDEYDMGRDVSERFDTSKEFVKKYTTRLMFLELLKEKLLKSDLKNKEERVKSVDKAYEATLNNMIRNAGRSLDEVEGFIESNFPYYFDLKNQSTDALKSQLTDNVAFESFQRTLESRRLYIERMQSEIEKLEKDAGDNAAKITGLKDKMLKYAQQIEMFRVLTKTRAQESTRTLTSDFAKTIKSTLDWFKNVWDKFQNRQARSLINEKKLADSIEKYGINLGEAQKTVKAGPLPGGKQIEWLPGEKSEASESKTIFGTPDPNFTVPKSVQKTVKAGPLPVGKRVDLKSLPKLDFKPTEWLPGEGPKGQRSARAGAASTKASVRQK